MVSKNCLLAIFFIKSITALTNLDDEVVALGGARGDWWYDDFVYIARGGNAELNLNAWYNGYDPDSRLNETVTCSICLPDSRQSPPRKIHGWYEQVSGR